MTVAATKEDAKLRRRRWGDGRALSDDDEAARLLLEAAGRCIVRGGSAKISMAEVAEEANVSRSTLHRYFSTRTELVRALLLSRAEGFVAASVASLPDRTSAAASLSRMILHPVESVHGTPINDALFSPRSEGLAVSVELESEAIYEIALRHFGPVLQGWQADGQLYGDLSLPETIRWIIALAVLLISSPWRNLSAEEREAFVQRYAVRAMVTRPV